MMALFKSTLLLCPVISLQFLVCICRWHHADVLGLAKDGVVVVAGVMTVYEATPTPALLYAALCFAGFFYDAIVSMQWMGFMWMSTRMSYANFNGIGLLLESLLVASAPIVSVVGAVLAGRIYFLSRAVTRAELYPLLGSGPSLGKDGHKLSSPPQQYFWPSAPAPPPPPLSGGVLEPTRSSPFRAIFGTPLPKSPRSALAERTPIFTNETPIFIHEEPGAVL